MNELMDEILDELYRVRAEEHRQPKAIRISKPVLKAALTGSGYEGVLLVGRATLFGVLIEYVTAFEVIW